MYLRANHRDKDGKDHTYWSLVETVCTLDEPRQRTLVLLGGTEQFGAHTMAENGRSLTLTASASNSSCFPPTSNRPPTIRTWPGW
jgi:hypothetical protein